MLACGSTVDGREITVPGIFEPIGDGGIFASESALRVRRARSPAFGQGRIVHRLPHRHLRPPSVAPRLPRRTRTGERSRAGPGPHSRPRRQRARLASRTARIGRAGSVGSARLPAAAPPFTPGRLPKPIAELRNAGLDRPSPEHARGDSVAARMLIKGRLRLRAHGEIQPLGIAHFSPQHLGFSR